MLLPVQQEYTKFTNITPKIKWHLQTIYSNLTTLSATCRFQQQWRISESASQSVFLYFIKLHFRHVSIQKKKKLYIHHYIPSTSCPLLNIPNNQSSSSVAESINKSFTSTAGVLHNRRAKTMHHPHRDLIASLYSTNPCGTPYFSSLFFLVPLFILFHHKAYWGVASQHDPHNGTTPKHTQLYSHFLSPSKTSLPLHFTQRRCCRVSESPSTYSRSHGTPLYSASYYSSRTTGCTEKNS